MSPAPAIALLEFDSVASGIESGDAMVKRAPLQATWAGTVQPGKFLVLVAGDVASVEEAVAAGRAVGAAHLVDVVFLPDVHPDVVGSLGGARTAGAGEALGVIETRTVAAVVRAADAGVKGAVVSIAELRVADGLGGRGYVLFHGTVADVEAAVEIGRARVPDAELIGAVVIPQLHDEMRGNLDAAARFRDRTGGLGGGR